MDSLQMSQQNQNSCNHYEVSQSIVWKPLRNTDTRLSPLGICIKETTLYFDLRHICPQRPNSWAVPRIMTSLQVLNLLTPS